MEKSEIKKTKNPYIQKIKDSDSVILLLHGFGGTAEDVRIFLKYLSAKGYSVVQPYFSGYEKVENYQKENLHFGPDEWLEESKRWLEKLSEEFKNVILVGFSFGGNICLDLAAGNNKKIKGAVVLETPVFFTRKISLMLNFVQPFLRLLGIPAVRPYRVLYRKGFKKCESGESRLPVTSVGKIYKFIKKKTRKNLSKIECPLLIMQAEKSDLLRKKSSEYIYHKTATKLEKKDVFYLRVDNHDLNLMDEEGKILMMEKINKFLNKLK